MKILKVSLRNLNSLRGDFQIDLENGVLAQAGIFAITGPTGAGKSTILDAITLALYGRAARYGSDSPEDMMSRHTGECRAEVEFSVKAGRYQASWHLNRARNKVDGKIQPAQRRVLDAGGVTLAQNMTQADAEIERLTGLNYERFLRSVLLAQGDFARFLRANANQRADLLEQLTGTEIYTALSKRAHVETGRLEEKLGAQERARELIVLLTETEREEGTRAIGELTARLTAGAAAHDAAAARLERGRQLQARLAEGADIAAREGAFTRRRERADIDFQRLERHRQAQPFREDLGRVDAAKKRAADERQHWHLAQTSAQEAARTLTVARIAARRLAETEVTTRAGELARRQEEETAAAAELAAIHRWLEEHANNATLDAALPTVGAKLAHLANARREQSRLRKKEWESREHEQTLWDEAAKTRQQLDGAATELAGCLAARTDFADKLAVLLDGRSLAAFQADLKRRHAHKELLIRLEVLLQKWVTGSGAEKVLRSKEENLTRELVLCRERAEAARAEAAALGKLDEALAENLAAAKLFASFEETRAGLTAGQPCPLCGSEHHPYAAGTAHLPANIAEITARHEETRKDLKAAETRQRENDRALTRVAEQHRAAVEGLAALGREVGARREDFAAQAREHGVTLAEPDEFRAALAEMSRAIAGTEERINGIQVLQAGGEDAARVYGDLRVSAAKQEEAVKGAAAAIGEMRRQREALAREIANGQWALQGLTIEIETLLEPFAEFPPPVGAEEALRGTLENRRTEYARQTKAATELTAKAQELRHRIRDAEGGWQRALQAAAELSGVDPSAEYDDALAVRFAREWRTPEVARERVAELAKSEAAAAATADLRGATYHETCRALEADDTALRVRLAEVSAVFAGVESLRAAQLPEGEMARVERDRRALDLDAGALQSQRQRLEIDLAALRAQGTPEGDGFAALEQECRERKTTNEDLIARRTRADELLRRDDENRAARAQRSAEIEHALTRLRYWRKLNDLIGSYDGGKFRKFAQGLSFDLLVRHANRHLSRLNERYRLQRAEDKELTLRVVDLYQAGSTRPMESLSGGESFLTSLALALGLSDLAGRNVRIDSLFVDEGFGSLDAEALDTAVAALESLRMNNKTVGVISHVEMLKERIAAQIQLRKLPGGLSAITITG